MKQFKTDVSLVKKRMIDLGIDTLTELTAKSGLSRTTVYKVMHENYRPQVGTFEALALALELEPSEVGEYFFAKSGT